MAGAIFTINTLAIGLGQGLVVRSVTGRVRWQVLVAADAAFVMGYVMFATAAPLQVGVATALVLCGALVYTLGEALDGPVRSAVNVESAPVAQRGRYLATVQLTWNISGVVGPLMFSWLLSRGALAPWCALAATSLVSAGLAGVAARVLPASQRGVSQLSGR